VEVIGVEGGSDGVLQPSPAAVPNVPMWAARSRIVPCSLALVAVLRSSESTCAAKRVASTGASSESAACSMRHPVRATANSRALRRFTPLGSKQSRSSSARSLVMFSRSI
jgi:hypothetical protein